MYLLTPFIILFTFITVQSLDTNLEPVQLLNLEPIKRIRIGLVDSGINLDVFPKEALCKEGHADFSGSGNLDDVIGHGTIMALSIMSSLSAKTHCIVNIKWVNKIHQQDFNNALEYAALQNISYINISAGGGYAGSREYKAIKVALIRDIKVSVAAGNDMHNLDEICPWFPACHRFPDKFFYVVGALDKDGNKAFYSNYGSSVNAWAYGEFLGVRGTSVATAIHTGRLARRDYLNSL